MDPNKPLRINAPQVVHETIDGETIVINLDKGTYYSLNGSAATLWTLLEQEPTVREMIEKAALIFSDFDQECQKKVEDFTAALFEEELIVVGQSSGIVASEQPMAAQFESMEGALFSPPVLSKYSDMQDLLLLDPIHDVDDSGWPTAKE
jgi:hypothetical protein